MPQMMPLNWLSLMIFFVITFMIFNSLMFFNYFPLQSSKLKNSYIKKNNWKW